MSSTITSEYIGWTEVLKEINLRVPEAKRIEQIQGDNTYTVLKKILKVLNSVNSL